MSIDLANIPYDLEQKAVPVRIDESNVIQLLRAMKKYDRAKTCPIASLLNLYLQEGFTTRIGTGHYGVEELRINEEEIKEYHTLWKCPTSIKADSWIEAFDKLSKDLYRLEELQALEDATILLDKVGRLETWMWLPTSMLS